MGRTEKTLAITTSLGLSFALGLMFNSIVQSFVEPQPISIQTADLIARDTLRATQSVAFWTRFEAILGLFAGLAAYFAYKAYKAGRISAIAAVESNEIVRKHAELETRAYVSLRKARITFDSNSKLLTFSFLIKNFGKTPGKYLKIWLYGEVSDEYPIQIKYNLSEFDALYFGSINPNQEFWIETQFGVIDDERLQRLRSGELKFCAGVVLRFEDEFGRRRLAANRLGCVAGRYLCGESEKVASFDKHK